ncbi:MAG: hypothetical protein ACLR1V_12995 [Coprococcus sp.]
MSPLAALILIVIAIVISVIFGTKKANMGLIAFGLAYILGCYAFWIKSQSVVYAFPGKGNSAVYFYFVFLRYLDRKWHHTVDCRRRHLILQEMQHL